MDRMPHEDHERMFNTFVRWSRYGGLFHYHETEQRLGLGIQHAERPRAFEGGVS